MPARREIYATHRALARALAQLAPICTAKVIAIVAKALAEGEGEAVASLRPFLNDAEYARAWAKAVRILQKRDIALFDDLLRRCKVALVSCCRRLFKLRIIDRERRRRRVTNK